MHKSNKLKVADRKSIIELLVKLNSKTISDSEKAELKSWAASSPQFQDLYQKMESDEAYLNWFQELAQVDVDKAWKNFEKISKKDTGRKVGFRVFKYAAIFILLLGFGSLIFYFVNDGNPGKSESSFAEFKPGEAKAELILANGTILNLSAQTQDTIIVTKDAKIRNSTSILSYEGTTESAPNEEVWNTLHTPRGGGYRLVLSDGTKVWLNSATQLEYPEYFVGENRVVKLNGEAYFEVAHNADKPFLVELNDIGVKVLGTSFNIMAYDDESAVETTLLEGSVEISTQENESVRIVPSEQAVYSKPDRDLTTKLVDPEQFVAWKNDIFIFDNEALGSIFKKLSRWYFVNIEFEDASIESLHFTGYFRRYDEIGKILELIEATNKVEFKVRGNEILVAHKE